LSDPGDESDSQKNLQQKPAEPDYGLSRKQRLTRSLYFKEAFDQDRSAIGRYMILRIRTGNDADRRLGIITSRKVGGAVQRNRARRRIREAWRLQRSRVSKQVDVVIICRRKIEHASAAAVAEEMTRLLASLNKLSAQPPARLNGCP
jgi:ribonuclease P protein component